VRAAPEAESDETDRHPARRKKPAAQGSKAAFKLATYRGVAGWLNQAYSLIGKSMRDLPALLEEVSPVAWEKGKIEGLAAAIVEDAQVILHTFGEQAST
jgi:hypothetical protein